MKALCSRCFLPVSPGRHGLYKCPLEPRSRDPRRIISTGKAVRRDPETVLAEYGAEKLSESTAGRAVLANARQKYKKELLQPADPDFYREYGKEIRAREEARREQERVSRELKRAAGWEA